jgi:cell division protease FtsH
MPSYSGLLRAIRAGQVEQLQLLPREDEVQVHFKDGRQGRVPVISNDQQILRTAEAAKVPLSVNNGQGDSAATGLLRLGGPTGPGLWPQPGAAPTGRQRQRAL